MLKLQIVSIVPCNRQKRVKIKKAKELNNIVMPLHQTFFLIYSDYDSHSLYVFLEVVVSRRRNDHPRPVAGSAISPQHFQFAATDLNGELMLTECVVH